MEGDSISASTRYRYQKAGRLNDIPAYLSFKDELQVSLSDPVIFSGANSSDKGSVPAWGVRSQQSSTSGSSGSGWQHQSQLAGQGIRGR